MNEERLKLIQAILKVLKKFPNASMSINDYSSSFNLRVELEEKDE